MSLPPSFIRLLALVLASAASIIPGRAALNQGLKGYWPLDSNLTDQSPTLANGSFSGTAAISYAAGKFGNAVSLDGIDQYVIINSVASNTFDFGTGSGGTGSMTVSAWFTTGPWDTTAYQTLVGKGEASNWRIARSNLTSNLYFSGGGPADIVANVNVNDGNWHHAVAITEGGVSTRLWIDGQLRVTGAVPTLGNQNGKFMMIGNNPDNIARSWKGKIDEVAVWNRVLTPGEIASIWNTGTGQTIANLLVGGDSDGDGLTDMAETAGSANPWHGVTLGSVPGDPTDPLVADSDGDGIEDGEEVVSGADGYITNPNAADTDGDGIPDGKEIAFASDPRDSASPVLNWSLGLAAYWPMDGDYTDRVGVSGAPANGTLMSASATSQHFVSGKFGQAANLFRDATNNEYIAINGVDENWFDFAPSLNSSTYPTATGKLSVSLWCKTTAFDTAWQALIAKGEGTSWRVARRNSTNGVAFAGGSADTPATDAAANLYPVNNSQWHHVVAISENGVSTRLWFDGVLISTGAAPTLANGTSVLLLGANPEQAATRYRSWNGQIDDVAMWSRILSPAEIYLLNNNGTGRPLSDFLTPVPDNDGMDDAWETAHGLDPFFDDSALDLDSDGLTNLQEFQAGTNPTLADTDGDGASDALELATGYNPVLASNTPPAGSQYAGQVIPGTVGKFLNAALPPVAPGGLTGSWQTEDYFTGQGNFAELKGVAAEPNSTYIAVIERRGTIQRVNVGANAAERATVTSKQQTLDIQSRIVYGDNGGLRSVAFSPDFNIPGAPGENYMYVFYSTEARADVPGFTAPYVNYAPTNMPYFFYRVSRFTRNPATGVFDSTSEQVMIQQMTRDRGQHFSGGLVFGKDGFLYVTWGDTEFSAARVVVPFAQDDQRIDRIFQSSILRLDVKMQGGTVSQPPTVTLQGNTGPKAMSGTVQSCLTDHNYYHHDNFSGVGYYIPSDNYWVVNPPPPGVASTNPVYPAHGPALGEHYAKGARNPWRITCDPVSGDIAMFVVGANASPQSETVDILRPGANFGWPYREAETSKTPETGRTHPPGGNSYSPVFLGIETYPIAYWPNSSNVGVTATGGLYYRGTQWPSVVGKLIAADHNSGRIWAIDYLNAGPASTTFIDTGGVKHPSNFTVTQLADTSHAIRQMCASPDGQDILIAESSGTTGNIWRLYFNGVPNPEPPALLSQTGAFTSPVASLTPTPAMIPFEPGAPLWSDRAHKSRWMVIPNNVGGASGAYDVPAEKILFSENGEWAFPKGSVFVKNFSLPLDERDPNNPALLKKIETRFVVRGEDGGYYFFSYQWNDTGTEATLIPAGDTTVLNATYPEIAYIDAAGVSQTQHWSFPSRAQCVDCHQPAAGSVLGVKTRQLNNFFGYPSSALPAHQLATLNQLGLFDSKLDARQLLGYLTSHNITDDSISKEDRVRSYLDSNCSQCHRPGGSAGQATFDARLSTPLTLAGLLNAEPHAGDLGVTGASIVTPRSPDRSILWLRDNSVGENQMPPLGKNLVHGAYIDILTDWIKGIGLPGFVAWAQSQGIPGGPEDDFDNDGISNGLEFLLGRDPKVPSPSSVGSIAPSGEDMVFELPLAGSALSDGFSPLLEDSQNLLDWYPAGSASSMLRPLDNSSSPGIDGIVRWKFLPAVNSGFVRTGVLIPPP